MSNLLNLVPITKLDRRYFANLPTYMAFILDKASSEKDAQGDINFIPVYEISVSDDNLSIMGIENEYFESFINQKTITLDPFFFVYDLENPSEELLNEIIEQISYYRNCYDNERTHSYHFFTKTKTTGAIMFSDDENGGQITIH